MRYNQNDFVLGDYGRPSCDGYGHDGFGRRRPSTLADVLREFINQRVTIISNGRPETVIVTEVNDNFLRAVNIAGPNTGTTKVFNISRIDFVEDFNP